jgi:hypothetical protein
MHVQQAIEKLLHGLFIASFGAVNHRAEILHGWRL